MVTAQLRVTQPTPHWPEHLPGSTARVRQTRAASKHQKAKATSNKIAQTEPDPHLQCPRLLPSTGDLASQQRHSSLAARNISQLPGLHKRWEHGGAFSTLPGSQPPPWAGTALAAPPATPTNLIRKGCLSFTYPGAMDGVVKVRSFRGQQQPATINGFGLQRNSNTHSQQKMAQHGSAPQGIDGQGTRETAAAPAK